MKIVFDATPLVTTKSGIGYFTESLIEALANTYPNELDITGHYFNFLGRRDLSLATKPNLRYISSKLLPGRAVNALRKIHIQPPFELLTHQTADIMLFPNFISLPTAKRAVNTAIIYDLSFVDSSEYTPDKLRHNLQKWVGPTVKRADLIITISEFTKRRIIDYYQVSPEKVLVIPIPPREPVPANEEIIEKFKLDSGFLLFVGTIEPRKNLVNLIRAYELLPSKVRESFPLVLAGGKGWHDEKILATVAAAQSRSLNVIQTGYITNEEKAALYEKSTLCVQPSHYEGFGMPILEAMSYAKPVLCSDIAVFREVAANAATYFDKDSPQKIAAAIQNSLEPAKLQDLSVRSQDHFQKYPTWDSVAVRVYERLSLEVSKKR